MIPSEPKRLWGLLRQAAVVEQAPAMRRLAMRRLAMRRLDERRAADEA
jgi:hypothetical protein